MATDDTNNSAKYLAICVAAFSLLVVMILGGIALCIVYKTLALGDKAGATSLLQYIFGAILPLIATWMGTVMAFYFGSKNFEAASNSIQASNKSMQDVVNRVMSSDDKLKSIPATSPDAMIALAGIDTNTKIADTNEADIKVKADLIDYINSSKAGERLPILSSKNALRYILHKSTLTDFLSNLADKKYKDLDASKPEAASLDDAINKTDETMNAKITKSAAFVSKTASLYDVQQKMIDPNNKNIQDVFVTDTGNAAEPIIGWITNNKITELGRV